MQGLLGFETFLFKINICWKLSEIYFGYPRHRSCDLFGWEKQSQALEDPKFCWLRGGGICDAGAMRASTPNDGATSCGVDIQALKKGYPNKKTPYLLMNMNIQVEAFWEHGCFHWFFSRSCETETHDFLRAFPHIESSIISWKMRWTTSGQVSIRNSDSPWLASLK